MAELNETITLLVRDLEVDVEYEWGELRDLARLIDGADETSAGGVFDAMTAALKKFVVDIRGLTRKGKAVPYNSGQVIDKMNPKLVKELFEALMSPEKVAQAGDPLADGTPPPTP